MTHSFHSRNFERPFCGPESRSTRSRSSEADPLRTQFRPTRARLPRRGEQHGRKKCCCRPTRCHLFAASEACDVVHSPHSRASRGFEVEWSEWADASVRVAALIQASARRVASERTPGRAPLAPLALETAKTVVSAHETLGIPNLETPNPKTLTLTLTKP